MISLHFSRLFSNLNRQSHIQVNLSIKLLTIFQLQNPKHSVSFLLNLSHSNKIRNMQLLFLVKSMFSSFFQAFTVLAGSLKYLKFISSWVLKIFWRKAFWAGGKTGVEGSEGFSSSEEGSSWLCPFPWLCECPWLWLWLWFYPCEHFLGATYYLCAESECDF